jgi:hypothetical protein
MQAYQNTALITNNGVTAPWVGASCAVYLKGTLTLATIYSDNGITTTANPLTTSATGNIFFYAADGRYDVTVSGTGYATVTIPDVLLEDVTNASPITASTLTVTGAATFATGITGGLPVSGPLAVTGTSTVNGKTTATYSTDSSGNVTGLVGPSGVAGYVDAGFFGASTSATAAVNTAAIQTALNKGGLVTLNAPGVYLINATLLIGDNSTFSLGDGATIRLAPAGNCNMLRTTNWGSPSVSISNLATADGITVTATSTHGQTVGSTGWRFVTGATPEAYNGVWFVTYTTTSAFTYKIAVKAPSETVTTPATGTIVSFLANGNITVTGGTWDYDTLNQTTPDTYQRIALYLRRVRNVRLKQTNLLNASKYTAHFVNCYGLEVDDIYFDTASDCLHIGGSGRAIVARNLRGKGGDDFFAVTQGDYAQYVDTGYMIGNFDDINVDGISGEGSFDMVKLVPQSGYTWGFTDIENVAGRFSGGANGISCLFDSGVVKQDGVTPSTVGTINAIKIIDYDNQQASSKPLITVGCVLNSLMVSNLTATLGTTSGTSVALQIGATGVLNKLSGTNWHITGGSTNAGAINVAGSGTLGDVDIANFNFSTLSSAVTFNATSVPTGTVMFSNGRGDGMLAFVNTSVRGSGSVPIPVLISSVKYTAPTGAFFTGNSASAQISAYVSSSQIPNGAVFGGTWLNRIADFVPEQIDTITYAATITPDLSLGSMKVCTFTGNMTINAPSSLFSTNGQQGRMITFILIRNAAAAAITWAATYKFPVAFVDSVANTTRTVVQFRYDDNGNCVCVSGTNAWN